MQTSQDLRVVRVEWANVSPVSNLCPTALYFQFNHQEEQTLKRSYLLSERDEAQSFQESKGGICSKSCFGFGVR